MGNPRNCFFWKCMLFTDLPKNDKGSGRMSLNLYSKWCCLALPAKSFIIRSMQTFMWMVFKKINDKLAYIWGCWRKQIQFFNRAVRVVSKWQIRSPNEQRISKSISYPWLSLCVYQISLEVNSTMGMLKSTIWNEKYKIDYNLNHSTGFFLIHFIYCSACL